MSPPLVTIEENCGAVAANVNCVGLIAVPPAVVTVTLTDPEPAGDVTVICVAELTMIFSAEVGPKRTLAPAVKPVPVIVTMVPPVVGPICGVMDVMVGATTTSVL